MFSSLLRAFELPCAQTGNEKPYDLASLRGGGATWLLHQTESPDYVRRRGRWLSARVMEVYLQETWAITCTVKISPRTKCSVQLVFLDTGMPPRAWYSLLECRCSYAEC